MKLALLTSLVASAAAFAPTKQASSSTSLASYKDAIGAQAPLGFFDPMGVMNNKDEAEFARLRALEVKHGRIASECSSWIHFFLQNRCFYSLAFLCSFQCWPSWDI